VGGGRREIGGRREEGRRKKGGGREKEGSVQWGSVLSSPLQELHLTSCGTFAKNFLELP
jgi:hypothetical protein